LRTLFDPWWRRLLTLWLVFSPTGLVSAALQPATGSGPTALVSVTTLTVSLGAGVTLSPGGRLNFSGVPTGGLFVLAPASHANYLIETNPLCASYTSFLSSDYFPAFRARSLLCIKRHSAT